MTAAKWKVRASRVDSPVSPCLLWAVTSYFNSSKNFAAPTQKVRFSWKLISIDARQVGAISVQALLIGNSRGNLAAGVVA
jgi:hypothetical protein